MKEHLLKLNLDDAREIIPAEMFSDLILME